MPETALFRTPVEIDLPANTIQPTDGCVLLGSCFAQEMGSRMNGYGLKVLCNPTGTLYNPASIALLIHHALMDNRDDLPIFEAQGQWCCWLAGTQIKEKSQADIISRMTDELDRLKQALITASHLFVTLGTNICYRLQDNGYVVTNCHKMPASLFREESLSLSQCTETLLRLTDELLGKNSDVEITFTVSPYRYAKYGFHKSQLAKSTLLLAVEEICAKRKAANYFPAYEILLDELRDYRFYADDMLHPSDKAVDYIWQQFCQRNMSKRTQQYLREYEPVRKGLTHRPSDPDSPEYKAFKENLERKKQELKAKYGIQEEKNL